MKVFVTGHKGFIGTHLVRLLKEAGHTVTGCDLALFAGCEWESLPKPDHEIAKDVRTLTVEDIEGHDCVMHLAAISNDPMGDLDEHVTYSINRDGSIRLARLAKAAGVPRFLFAGSCSVYGKKGAAPLDETASFEPLSAYAKSKVEAEIAIRELADTTFCPVSLRNATAYGASPMLRLDLVANNLLACAYALGDIRVQSDGSPWRPLVHCKDIARAFVAFMEAPTHMVHNKAINVGGNSENYQVKDVADMVKKLVPTANVVFTGETGADPRSYCVNFDLLAKTLPNFKLEYDLWKGMQELQQQFVAHNFNADDFKGDKYFRLRAIKKTYPLLAHALT
ncbi:MAG: SDR family oxidoreductase [Chlamydiales bacterium]|nr:SDR family oxidoreductase [Chlamydiales bacterium]